MKRRIEVSSDAEGVRIARRVLNELCAHALETQPEECCGLVTGNALHRFRSVHRCRNEMTLRHQSDPMTYPRDGRAAFYMSEIDYLKAQSEAETRGEWVTAVYHSHVDAGAYFSTMDRAYAEHALFPFPDAAHIVLAIWDHKVAALGFFERDAATGAFTGRPVEAGEP
ncbi:MAG: Mov34/MPN/PAD-1 family protein [Proteobacteria bacterium]|nr:Mov34/MPN/PAD-1 family protein [Pseudomonadota bacterium]